MTYLIVILLSMAVVTVVNTFTVAPELGYGFGKVLLWVTVCTVSVIAIDGLFAWIVRRLLPNKLFAVENTSFSAGKKERRLYEKIGIKKWKDKILDLGVFTAFPKNKISDPKNPEYVAKYITEANFGVVCHLADIIFGICAVFCCPRGLWLTVGVPVVAVNVVLNALPVFSLRYNLPKLHALYKYNKKREEKSLNGQ